MRQPKLFRNAIAILEPWQHVGCNPEGEEVRASLNVAYIAQKIADCDSILFPLWSSGLPNPDQLVPLITAGLAVVVEGGDPSVRNAATFAGSRCSLHELHDLVTRLLLSRSPTSAVVLFICLGHQLAAQSHIALLKRVVKQVLGTESLTGDDRGQALQSLEHACRQIETMGRSLWIRKQHSGRP
jgi:hypothetical protein